MLLVAASAATAQQPAISIIDVYGARSFGVNEIRKASGLQPGDSVTPGLDRLVRARLRNTLGVGVTEVSFVCCEAGGTIVYIGVNEQDGMPMLFNAPPAGAATLPEAVVAAGERFGQALQDAMLSGQPEEDDSLGHSLMRYPPARAIQQEFASFALTSLPLLRSVLRESANAEHRALAAQVIAYALNKNAVIPDLMHAVRDPDPSVRNNAIRALWVMARYAERKPESGLRVPYEPFVALLNSPHWTDRNKAAMVLLSLSAGRNPAMMKLLRERALPALTDMVHWQAQGHALPAAFLLGRMGGLPDDAIFAAFQNDRNSLVAAARSPI